MRFNSLSNSNTPPSEPDETLTLNTPISTAPDFTSFLTDQILTLILSNLTKLQQISSCLVCKRWSRISGGLVKSLRLLDWEFLDSGRLALRFPNLIDVDIVQACIISPRNSGINLSNKFVSIHVNSFISGFIWKPDYLGTRLIDRGVRILAHGCPNLRKLVLFGASKDGLESIANNCLALQELELCSCTDLDLKALAGFRNLQILKLVGSVNGLYNDDSVISDIGLTILAQVCPRLLKLELVGCEGSYDGIKAIGQCCHMIEELTFVDHKLEGGWLAALSYCTNLKTLRFQSCKFIDTNPGPIEHLGSCPTLEELYLERCQLRDKQGVKALFLVCDAVRELVFEDCWGLDDNSFGAASICRYDYDLMLSWCGFVFK